MEKQKKIVLLIISRIVDHIYAEAKMVRHCHDNLLIVLFEYIWERVRDEDQYISDQSSLIKQNNPPNTVQKHEQSKQGAVSIKVLREARCCRLYDLHSKKNL